MKRVLMLGALLFCGCHGSSKPDGGSTNGPGERCTADSDCASSTCVLPDPNTPIGFCSEPCKHVGDCFAHFPGGCCIPTSTGVDVCAIAAICNDTGDAGLGDTCPNMSDCGAGLICLSDSSGAITECSHVCQTDADCGGVAQECCENLAPAGTGVELMCVLDPSCGAMPDAGPTYDGGPIGPGGDDGGPFYAGLFIDGALTADTTAYQATVGPDFDDLVAPPLGRNAELDLHASLSVGTYACDGGGDLGDGGPYAVLATVPDNSPTFAALLPRNWQGQTFAFLCGPVGDADGHEVQAAVVDITDFTPGRVRSLDAGPVRGHLAGTAYLRVGFVDGGGSDVLELREHFDVPLIAP